MGQLSESFVTAHHEAAHAVVNYRACGHAGGAISIVADSSKVCLGFALDAVSDSFNAEHLEARILSCYAGGHAQRRLDPRTGADGCDADDDIAAELLRERSADLVSEYWAQIVAVAKELLQTHVLDDAEVETIADIVMGEATSEDLARYRLLKGGV